VTFVRSSGRGAGADQPLDVGGQRVAVDRGAVPASAAATSVRATAQPSRGGEARDPTAHHDDVATRVPAT